jgi:adenylate kinase
MATVSDRYRSLSVEALREAPSQVITRADVDATDKKLIGLVGDLRKHKHVLVDSHPMSKEPYGFRITPFTQAQISELSPDVIVCLYADPAEIARRIHEDAAGRPLPSEFELSMHVTLQATVAAQYAYTLGVACHLLDGAMAVEELGEAVCRVAKIQL